MFHPNLHQKGTVLHTQKVGTRLRSSRQTIGSFWIRPFLGRHSLGFWVGVSIFWYPESRHATILKMMFPFGWWQTLLTENGGCFSGEFHSFGDQNSHLHLKSWPGRRVSKRPFWPSVSWEAADVRKKVEFNEPKVTLEVLGHPFFIWLFSEFRHYFHIWSYPWKSKHGQVGWWVP